MWERDRLKRIAVITNDEIAWNNYGDLENLVNYKLRTTKSHYYGSFFNDNKGHIKNTWKGINSLLSKNKYECSGWQH
jgi:hypothetical protein